MPRISVQLNKTIVDSYDIQIERGLLKKLASDLRMKRFCDQYVVISDTKVNKLYGKTLIDSLKREKLFLGKVVVPAGEKSKSFDQLKNILEKMVEMGANRKTGIIALGGGVVGDLAGYAAASFMRGVEFIQVPTTLLAMVDSSIGGKVGIDLDTGKNLAGAFWQPKKVYVDPDVLKTLLQKQWKAGLGEAVKYGAIKDRSLWDFFEKHTILLNKSPKDFLPSEWKVVEEMIERCIQIKVDVVMKDEKEGNLRQILNYGHTFGHVVELMSEYNVLHGEAVAVGMRMASALAVEMRTMPNTEAEKQNLLLDTLLLGKTKTKGLISEFIKHMKKDKKAKGDLRVVLCSRIGTCQQQLGDFSLKIDEKVLKKVLKETGLITDKKKEIVRKVILSTPQVTSNPSWSSPQTSTYSSSAVSGETDLQKRLREMRERRSQRMDGSSSSAGGFLPG
jgi:3-dehydroquinate synthase